MLRYKSFFSSSISFFLPILFSLASFLPFPIISFINNFFCPSNRLLTADVFLISFFFLQRTLRFPDYFFHRIHKAFEGLPLLATKHSSKRRYKNIGLRKFPDANTTQEFSWSRGYLPEIHQWRMLHFQRKFKQNDYQAINSLCIAVNFCPPDEFLISLLTGGFHSFIFLDFFLIESIYRSRIFFAGEEIILEQTISVQEEEFSAQG